MIIELFWVLAYKEVVENNFRPHPYIVAGGINNFDPHKIILVHFSLRKSKIPRCIKKH